MAARVSSIPGSSPRSPTHVPVYLTPAREASYLQGEVVYLGYHSFKVIRRFVNAHVDGDRAYACPRRGRVPCSPATLRVSISSRSRNQRVAFELFTWHGAVYRYLSKDSSSTSNPEYILKAIIVVAVRGYLKFVEDGLSAVLPGDPAKGIEKRAVGVEGTTSRLLL